MSFSSSDSFSTREFENSSVEAPTNSCFERPTPTILELGRMKGGAQKARLCQITSLKVDTIDESEECVDLKLSAARCLKHARSLGLQSNLVALRTFTSSGGAQYIAKELVRSFSSLAENHEDRLQKLTTQVKHFCEKSSADLD